MLVGCPGDGQLELQLERADRTGAAHLAQLQVATRRGRAQLQVSEVAGRAVRGGARRPGGPGRGRAHPGQVQVLAHARHHAAVRVQALALHQVALGLGDARAVAGVHHHVHGAHVVALHVLEVGVAVAVLVVVLVLAAVPSGYELGQQQLSQVVELAAVHGRQRPEEDVVACCGASGRLRMVVLFPDEAWARNATSSYWTLTPVWWSRSRCVVVEVSGTRRTRTRARMEESTNGNLHIVGSFKTDVDPNFKLCLTSRVSAADFNMGYCMTGTLERGCKRTNSFQVTHFAVIRRHEVATPTT